MAQDEAGVEVTRRLAIPREVLGDAVARLHRDTPSGIAHWTLGERGACELRLPFDDVGDAGFRGRGRLLDADHFAVAPFTLEIAPGAAAGRRSALSLRADGDAAARWRHGPEHCAALARTAADELAEELLWHASRVRATPTNLRQSTTRQGPH